MEGNTDANAMGQTRHCGRAAEGVWTLVFDVVLFGKRASNPGGWRALFSARCQPHELVLHPGEDPPGQRLSARAGATGLSCLADRVRRRWRRCRRGWRDRLLTGKLCDKGRKQLRFLGEVRVELLAKIIGWTLVVTVTVYPVDHARCSCLVRWVWAVRYAAAAFAPVVHVTSKPFRMRWRGRVAQ